MPEILKAVKRDICGIKNIYENIHDCEEKGLTTTGWIRNVYPTVKTAEDALRRGDLFVLKENGKIVATAVINRLQPDAYKYADWKVPANGSEVMVLHCLAVDQTEKGKGYGRAFIDFYADYAHAHNCKVLRMDTNVCNSKAQKLYSKLGFEAVGTVRGVFNGIPDVCLVCLEKRL